ncbi:MAG: Gfo/Idh/MocA family oxidoreductase [Candidatus Lindowbacteria bacterium]|nr:Gfo/Idh/MocA family oxidoreductase [Candidatus Lindowbacteria bacterium]
MKALFIGLGGAGQRHLRNLKEFMKDDLEVHAYRQLARKFEIGTDLSTDSTINIEEKYSIQTHDSLQNALAQAPDAVFISNPTAHHIPAALQAARAQCHLFIEKPLSHSLESLEELESVVSFNDLTGFVAYQLRFHPNLQKIKELLQSKSIGKITGASFRVSSYLPDWHKYEDFRDLYAAKKELGGGVLLTESHDFDIVHWFFGRPKNVFVQGGNLGPFELDVEDTVNALLHFEDPDPFNVQLRLCFVQKPIERSIEIFGTSGKILWRADICSVELHNDSGIEYFDETNFDRSTMFTQELRHFLRCINGKEAPIVDISTAKESLEIILACLQSLQTNQPVLI